MFKASVFLCCLIFCALTPYLSFAMTAEQKAKIHEHFETIAKKCYVDNQVSEDDINSLKSRKVPSGPNAPCFLACMMKESGLMDKAGALQKDSAMEMAKSIFEDGDELKLIEDYLHSCSHVNGEAVSDGEKGCDRAILAYKCMTENAAQFGFDV